MSHFFKALFVEFISGIHGPCNLIYVGSDFPKFGPNFFQLVGVGRGVDLLVHGQRSQKIADRHAAHHRFFFSSSGSAFVSISWSMANDRKKLLIVMPAIMHFIFIRSASAWVS